LVEQLIVVDYQEGAGGEFIASWLSAHFGQKLQTDLQSNPNHLQKWLNLHSLVQPDWQENFGNYLLTFNRECASQDIDKIAVSYHLYKYPEHVEILKTINQAKFVRINCVGFEARVDIDFNQKILDRVLLDFAEVHFMLKNQTQEKIKHFLNLFKQKKLTYRDLVPGKIDHASKQLPSDDIEIMYEDFFIDFKKTPKAYENLCDQLQLQPSVELLDALIDRNTKNLQHQLSI